MIEYDTLTTLVLDPEDYVTLSSVSQDYTLDLVTNSTLGLMNSTMKKIRKRGPSSDCGVNETALYRDPCYLSGFDTPGKQARILGEIILVVWSIIYIAIAVREWSFLGTKIFMQNMALCPSRVLFLLGCILLLLAVPFRLACNPESEDKLAILVMLFIGFYFLFFCRGFKTTGPFVIMIYRMMAADLLRFVIIYIIFVMGFAQCEQIIYRYYILLFCKLIFFSVAYFIIFQSYKPEDENENPNPMPNAVESVLKVFIMSLGVFGDIWDSLGDTNHSFIGKVLEKRILIRNLFLCDPQVCCFVFLAIVYILLVNLLIAMMGDTYTKIAEIKNEWMRQVSN